MQKSMTGFGKASTLVDNTKFTVEVRSLNSKQLDLSVKLPMQYRSAEFDIRSLIAKILVRGKIDVILTTENSIEQTTSKIDRELFGAYLSQLKDVAQRNNLFPNDDVLFPSVLRMPDVVSTPTENVTEAQIEAILSATKQAAESLDLFRVQEGNTLIADLLRRVSLIEDYRNQITPYEIARTEAIKERIRTDIASVGIEVDNNRLEQEMIFYIEKLDITEEKVRLENHCKYFREVASTEPNAGRKLGFIAQEMGREINTTGSKANNHEIQILVVKMKDELEKIKEQVLNLL